MDSGELQLWHTPSTWHGVLMSNRAALTGDAVLLALAIEALDMATMQVLDNSLSQMLISLLFWCHAIYCLLYVNWKIQCVHHRL